VTGPPVILIFFHYFSCKETKPCETPNMATKVTIKNLSQLFTFIGGKEFIRRAGFDQNSRIVREEGKIFLMSNGRPLMTLSLTKDRVVVGSCPYPRGWDVTEFDIDGRGVVEWIIEVAKIKNILPSTSIRVLTLGAMSDKVELAAKFAKAADDSLTGVLDKEMSPEVRATLQWLMETNKALLAKLNS